MGIFGDLLNVPPGGWWERAAWVKSHKRFRPLALEVVAELFFLYGGGGVLV